MFTQKGAYQANQVYSLPAERADQNVSGEAEEVRGQCYFEIVEIATSTQKPKLVPTWNSSNALPLHEHLAFLVHFLDEWSPTEGVEDDLDSSVVRVFWVRP